MLYFISSVLMFIPTISAHNDIDSSINCVARCSPYESDRYYIDTIPVNNNVTKCKESCFNNKKCDYAVYSYSKYSDYCELYSHIYKCDKNNDYDIFAFNNKNKDVMCPKISEYTVNVNVVNNSNKINILLTHFILFLLFFIIKI
jgi:hypothetical protein